MVNSSYIRNGKKQMCFNGETTPRNKALMKMFKLINIGEQVGRGVPNILKIWANEGWKSIIEGSIDPAKTVLAFPYFKICKERKKVRGYIEHYVI